MNGKLEKFWMILENILSILQYNMRKNIIKDRLWLY